MKNLFVMCLAMIFAVTMCVSVFAVPENFVSSPNGQAGPILIDSSNDDDDCDGEVEVTPYKDREDLDEDSLDDLEDAYNSLISVDDLGDLSDDLSQYAGSLGIPTGDLAISDLFDIACTGCDNHDDHGAFDVALQPEMLDGFVALVHYEDGKWDVVDGAKVDGNGHLVFTTNDFGPMAVVVDTDADRFAPPQTGDYTNIAIYVVMIVASLAALFVLFRRLGKEKSN